MEVDAERTASTFKMFLGTGQRPSGVRWWFLQHQPPRLGDTRREKSPYHGLGSVHQAGIYRFRPPPIWQLNASQGPTQPSGPVYLHSSDPDRVHPRAATGAPAPPVSALAEAAGNGDGVAGGLL
jgi:hypothetical protein